MNFKELLILGWHIVKMPWEALVGDVIDRLGMAVDGFRHTLHVGYEVRLLSHLHDGCGLSHDLWEKTYGLDACQYFVIQAFGRKSSGLLALLSNRNHSSAWVPVEYLEYIPVLEERHWLISIRSRFSMDDF